jgi:hypothetical protein
VTWHTGCQIAATSLHISERELFLLEPLDLEPYETV